MATAKQIQYRMGQAKKKLTKLNKDVSATKNKVKKLESELKKAKAAAKKTKKKASIKKKKRSIQTIRITSSMPQKWLPKVSILNRQRVYMSPLPWVKISPRQSSTWKR